MDRRDVKIIRSISRDLLPTKPVKAHKTRPSVKDERRLVKRGLKEEARWRT